MYGHEVDSGLEALGAGTGEGGTKEGERPAVEVERVPGAPLSSIILRASRAFSRVAGMNDWPPKPGLTDMSRMMSILSMTYLNTQSSQAKWRGQEEQHS